MLIGEFLFFAVRRGIVSIGFSLKVCDEKAVEEITVTHHNWIQE
jgi:hypothetical protein